MVKIPVIVGFGGVNAAGRSSFHHGYRRLIIDALDQQLADRTYASLASLMKLETSGKLSPEQRNYILEHTLIRRIEDDLFDVDQISLNKRLSVSSIGESPISFITKARNLPEHLPENWRISTLDNRQVRVDIEGQQQILVPSNRAGTVKAAGQLPTGFNPGKLYQSRSHPRGLQMAVYGASDAIQSMGVDWEKVCQYVAPDQISVYAASAMGQLEQHGHGGMLSSRFRDKRTTSKQCPLGFAEMPADFINAYVLGSVGNTGASVGACATFLYNLRQAIIDIQSGKARVAVVGSSEAPILADVMDGYAAMGALATDHELLALDAHLGLTEANYRRAARPFSTNCGFTIAESSQFVVLMDDALTVELGATVYGGITDVFVNADGHKKSISSPGLGNYITVAKAVASAKAILGEESVQQRSYVQAHGTSTPQNRVTESEILNETAKVFGIDSWKVSAIKAYIGHSIGVSSGDQMAASLGLWADGIIPGIATIDHVAEDVHNSHLDISPDHKEVGATNIDCSIINAKGFGGNNATAAILAPHVIEKMLAKRYSADDIKYYKTANEGVREQAYQYDEAAIRGEVSPIYKFDHNVMGGADIDYSKEQIRVPGFEAIIDLEASSPYSELIK